MDLRSTSQRAYDLLIIDDERAQARLFELLLKQLRLPHRCHHVSNGSDALGFLHQEVPYQYAPRPHLIILDLSMPGMHGCDVLRAIKKDSRLRTIPVVVLSNSNREDDVNDCYAAFANAYIRKPTDLEDSLRVLEGLDRFWFGTAQLPFDGRQLRGGTT